MAISKSWLNRYRTRNLLNRYVVLVLLWNWIIWVTIGNPTSRGGSVNLVSVFSTVQPYSFHKLVENIIYFLPRIFWVISAFFTVWLAGWKYKIQSIISVAMAILGAGVLLNAAIQTAESVEKSYAKKKWAIVLTCMANILVATGSAPCMTSMLQLAMEQMPGASGAKLSSTISWFVFSSVSGSWLHIIITGVYKNCVTSSEEQSKFLPMVKLFFAAVMTVALCTNALSKKSTLLDYSPSSNNIKLIYSVIKYTIQHKYPENRIAMVLYKPSRLNNSKRKYGGPFTNEEVEDVRTFIQLFILCLTTFLYLSTLYLNGYSLYYIDSSSHYHSFLPKEVTATNCSVFIHHYITGYNSWWLLVTIPVYELLLVPALDFRIPSLLCRVGFVAVTACTLSFFTTTLVAINFYSTEKFTIDFFWLKVALAIPIGVLYTFYYTAGLEFICAQAPYSMRNFFICSVITIMGLSPISSGMLFTLWHPKCTGENCPIVYSGVALILCVTGMVIFCVCAKRYRKRVRENEEEKPMYVEIPQPKKEDSDSST